MALINVEPENNVVLTNIEGDKFYLIVLDENTTRVYQRMGHLGSETTHYLSTNPDDAHITCEFLGERPCTMISRTVAPFDTDKDIFDYLRRVNI